MGDSAVETHTLDIGCLTSLPFQIYWHQQVTTWVVVWLSIYLLLPMRLILSIPLLIWNGLFGSVAFFQATRQGRVP